MGMPALRTPNLYTLSLAAAKSFPKSDTRSQKSGMKTCKRKCSDPMFQVGLKKTPCRSKMSISHVRYKMASAITNPNATSPKHVAVLPFAPPFFAFRVVLSSSSTAHRYVSTARKTVIRRAPQLLFTLSALAAPFLSLLSDLPAFDSSVSALVW